MELVSIVRDQEVGGRSSASVTTERRPAGPSKRVMVAMKWTKRRGRPLEALPWRTFARASNAFMLAVHLWASQRSRCQCGNKFPLGSGCFEPSACLSGGCSDGGEARKQSLAGLLFGT